MVVSKWLFSCSKTKRNVNVCELPSLPSWVFSNWQLQRCRKIVSLLNSIHCQNSRQEKRRLPNFILRLRNCQSLQPHPHPATSPTVRTNVRAYADVITKFSSTNRFPVSFRFRAPLAHASHARGAPLLMNPWPSAEVNCLEGWINSRWIINTNFFGQTTVRSVRSQT